MSLVGIKEMLCDARAKHYAVPAFDTSDYRFARAAVRAAEDLDAPVILMGLKGDMNDEEFIFMASVMRELAESASVPVCVHLDHAPSFELVQWAVELGYRSVMIDASREPLEKNIRITRAVTEYAHAHHVTVEAELGHVGDGIVGTAEADAAGHASALTVPAEMERFIRETEVDCLAVAIGTLHGVYREEPKLDIGLCRELNERSSVPLVLHGGSGTPLADVRQAIQNGVSKINVYSELCQAFFSDIKRTLDTADHLSLWQSTVFHSADQALYSAMCQKFKDFSADGKAGAIRKGSA